MNQDGFSISNFKAIIDENGVQRNNKFLVVFPIPIRMQGLQIDAPGTQKKLQFFAESATLPGTTLNLHPVFRYGMGLVEKRPFSATINDIKFSLIVDGSNQIYFYFKKWMQQIMNLNLSKGILTVDGGAQAPFELNYKYEYCVDVNIRLYNDAGHMKRNLILRDAFPTSIDDLPLNWGDTQNIMRLGVNFTFQDFFESGLDDTVPVPTGGPVNTPTGPTPVTQGNGGFAVNP